MRNALLILLVACGRPAAAPTSLAPVAPLAAQPAAAPAAPAPPKLRLPDTVSPLAYRLDLAIDPTKESFAGRVEIDVQLRQATSFFWLNASDLKVSSVELSTGGRVIAAQPVPAPPDFLGVSLPVAAPSGPATVRLAYEGVISTQDSDGIYRQMEKDEWYVFTQFEDTSARRAFPGFDEPSYKTPFQITLRVPLQAVAASNAPIASMTETETEKIVAFAPTKPLPTYLVALAVGPFDIVDGGTAGKQATPLRILAPRGRGKEARYAVTMTPRIVENLEAYFGLPYPYEKLDQVAVPRKGGAMENAGLVTYGQSILLIPEEELSIARKRRFAFVAAHEIAHHWFGDLVTLAWWDDVWLNESFATWMEDKVMLALEPTWDVEVDLVRGRGRAMVNDSFATARRIRQPIASKSDINDAFDGITYGKGAAVLTMFERWVGPEKFQKGIQRYLREHQHGVATTRDFLGAVSREAGTDVGPVFSTFLDQAGAPLLTARLDCEGPPRLVLAQERYLPVGSTGSSHQTWRIPLCARWGAGAAQGRDCGLLSGEVGELPLSAPACPDWVLPNEGMLGYYRARLEGDLLDRLFKGWKQLTLPEQVGVVGDVSALTSSAHLPLARALDLVPQLAREKSRHLQSAATGIVGFLSDEVTPPELRGKRARFIQAMFGKRARQLGWKPKPGDRDEDRLLRPTLLRLVAGVAEDPRFLAEARKLAERWLADEKSVDADMIGLILGVTASHGDRAWFDRLHEAARKEPERKRRTRLLGAMAGFRDPAIARAAMDLTLTDAFEGREVITLLWGALDEETTRGLAWAFLKENLDRLVARMPRDYAARFIDAGSDFCDATRRKEVEEFFKARAPTWLSGPRALAETLEGIDLCIAAKAAHGPGVAEFLKRY